MISLCIELCTHNSDLPILLPLFLCQIIFLDFRTNLLLHFTYFSNYQIDWHAIAPTRHKQITNWGKLTKNLNFYITNPLRNSFKPFFLMESDWFASALNCLPIIVIPAIYFSTVSKPNHFFTLWKQSIASFHIIFKLEKWLTFILPIDTKKLRTEAKRIENLHFYVINHILK